MRKIELQQGSQEWLDYRQNGIGASDIASIMAESGAFATKSQVLLEKLGHQKELTEFEKRIFNEGHEWEAVVRESLNQQGYSFTPAVVECEGNPRFFASLDGLDEEKKLILEVKSVQTQERFKEYCEKVPAHYNCQVQWQLMCTGYTNALIAFVHNGEVKVSEVKSDPMIQEIYQKVGYEFLRELDSVASTGIAVSKYVGSTEMDRISFLKKTQAEMQTQIDMIEEEIKYLAEKMLVENKAFKVENDTITVERVERQGSVDYKKIPELQNIDLNRFRKKGTTYLKVQLKKGTTHV